MSSWTELGVIFTTLRELDVAAIREEAERPIRLLCLGSRPLCEQLAAQLRASGLNRYGPAGADPLGVRPLSRPGPDDDLRHADLLLIVLDGRKPLPVAETAPLGRLAGLGVPTVILIVGVTAAGDLGPPRPEFAHAEIAIVPTFDAPEARETIAAAIFARLPEGLHLSAARRLPGLRDAYAQALMSTVSLTNASFALASALPQQIPILAVPFVAADIIVLTKNQALMVYRMGLAYGAPPEFRDRLVELGPVVGGGFFWRQVARSLVGLIPVWGVVPKVAVAYGGTHTTGVAAWRWFADGEVLTPARLQELTAEALRTGREIAEQLVSTARAQRDRAAQGLGGVRRMLPFAGRKKPDTHS